jgi:orotidine-5'-phosphate decarboxylase
MDRGREHATGFGERLSRRVAERRSQLVLGLDPDPGRLWPRAIELAGGSGEPSAPAAERAARAVAIHCTLAIEAAGNHCVAVKPQVACFERLGAPGWSALAEVVTRAREHGLLVIADAKRGDVDVSARAYAQAFFGETETPFGPVRGLAVDAMTVNPLLGTDSLLPLLGAARERASGLFLLVRTSNPDAAEIQGLALVDGGTVSDRLARIADALGSAGRAPGRDAGDADTGDVDTGDAGAIGDVGAVVGATAPDQLGRLREAMPRAPFLLPGVGAQGGRVEDLAAAFAPGPAGGLVSASRGIVDAHLKHGGDPATAAREEAARLRELAWSLAA